MHEGAGEKNERGRERKREVGIDGGREGRMEAESEQMNAE